MKALDFCLFGSIAVAAAAAGWWAFGPRGGGARPAAEAPRLVSMTIPVRAAFVPAASDATAVEGGTASTISVALDPGEELEGVASAVYFEDAGEKTNWMSSRDVTAGQTEGGLDLRRWVAAVPLLSARYLFHFVVVVRRESGREWRSAWALASGVDLRSRALSVRAPRRGTLRVRVATADGQAVPGAYAVAEPLGLEGSTAGVPVMTDGTGEAIISGLSEKGVWTVTTRLGVGPALAPAQATADLEGLRAAEVRVPLPGAWAFEKSLLETRFPGLPLGLASGPLPTGNLESVWPVSPLALPGQGKAVPFYSMRPGGQRAAAAWTLRLKGYEPVLLPVEGGGLKPVPLVVARSAAVANPKSQSKGVGAGDRMR